MQFLSLDGVSQGPGAPDEDTSDGFTRGGWFTPFLDETFVEAVAGWVDGADALLFGRRTYESFARDWPAVDDPDDPFAAKMNGLPKYVASRGLARADWAPTTILQGEAVAQVAALKRRSGRELQVHGSARLAASLLAAGLVDEMRLAIAPVVVGRGRRLFREGGAPGAWRPTSSVTTPAGLALHVYASAGRPTFEAYGTA